MRDALGDGYVEALRARLAGRAGLRRFRHVLVAQRRRTGPRRARRERFGFITTNSLRQTFNRRVAASTTCDAEPPLSLRLRHPRPPLGGQRRRRGGAHRHDRRRGRRSDRGCCSRWSPSGRATAKRLEVELG